MHALHGNGTFTIGTWNPNGLKSRGRKEYAINTFMKSTYDIMLISDHNLTKIDITELKRWADKEHEGVTILFAPRPPDDSHGGSGILVKHERLSIDPQKIDWSAKFGGRVTIAKWADGITNSIALCALYLPPHPPLRRALWWCGPA